MEFGIDLWLLHPVYEVEDALARAEDEGFSFIEYPYEIFEKVGADDLEGYARRISDYASALSLRPYQLHAEYGEINFELASSDAATRKRALRRLARWVELGSILGVRVLVTHIAFMRPSQEVGYGRALQRLVGLNVSIVKSLARRAEEHGIRIALENPLEPWFGASPLDLLYLVEETDPDIVGVCFDTGHANVNRLDVARAVEQLEGHIIATHIHDNDGRGDNHLPPLMGSIDWRRVMGAFRKAGGSPLMYEVSGGYPSSRRMADNRLELLKIVTGHLRGLA